jgi:hypothetical protein
MPKRRKVEESAAPYLVSPKAEKKKSAPSGGVRLADLDAVQKTNAKLMQVHRKVLQKLAQ